MRSESLALAPSILKAWGQTKPDLSNDPLSEFVKKSLANYYIINSGLALNKAVRFFYSLLSLLAHTLLGFIMAFFKRNVFIVSVSSMALALYSSTLTWDLFLSIHHQLLRYTSRVRMILPRRSPSGATGRTLEV